MSLENEHNHFLENPDKQDTLAKENAEVEIIPDLDWLRIRLKNELQRRIAKIVIVQHRAFYRPISTDKNNQIKTN